MQIPWIIVLWRKKLFYSNASRYLPRISVNQLFAWSSSIHYYHVLKYVSMLFLLAHVNLFHIYTPMQFAKENPLELSLPHIKLGEHEPVTEDAVSTSLRRAISRLSTLQAHDGHWPGDYGGPMFLLPGLVIIYYPFHCIILMLVNLSLQCLCFCLYNN